MSVTQSPWLVCLINGQANCQDVAICPSIQQTADACWLVADPHPSSLIFGHTFALFLTNSHKHFVPQHCIRLLSLSNMPWPLLVLLMAIPSFLQFVRSTPINATDPVPSVVVVDPSDAIFPSSTSPDNTDLSPSSSDNMLPPQLDIASTSQDVGDEEGTTVTEPLEQYFWERVHPSNCPLNCSSSTLQCWRLAG